MLENAKEANRADNIVYAMGIRRTYYNAKNYFRDIESAIELGAKFLITYFPREKNYIQYMKNFAKDVMTSFK